MAAQNNRMLLLSSRIQNALWYFTETRGNMNPIPHLPCVASPGVYQSGLFVDGANVRVHLDTNKGQARIVRSTGAARWETEILPRGMSVNQIAERAAGIS